MDWWSILLKHQVTSRDIRCPRLCEGFCLYPSSTHFKRHVTLISANHLIIIPSVETVPNAAVIIGTTVTFTQFLDPFQLPLQVFVVLIFSFSLSFTLLGSQMNKQPQ